MQTVREFGGLFRLNCPAIRRFKSEISNLNFKSVLFSWPVPPRKPPCSRGLPIDSRLCHTGNHARQVDSRPVLLPVAAVAAGAARADEIRLKDGTKIIGTIVGFENDSFRVETSYGFALIQKDKVADISIVAAKKDPEPKPKSTAPAPPPSSAAQALFPRSRKSLLLPRASCRNRMRSRRCAPRPAPAPPRMPAAKTDMAAPKIKTVAAAAPAPPVAPPAPPPAPEPVVIRDEIRGNQYVNLTYGFQMYKPPSWELIPAARKALPDAVAAMGTNDQDNAARHRPRARQGFSRRARRRHGKSASATCTKITA